MTATSSLTCPACGRGSLEPLLRIEGIPALVTELFTTREAARAAPSGDLDLAVCPACGLVRNLAFDPSLVEYTVSYENSQLFSPTFRDYARTLARHLVETYELAGKVVVEVGSGKGEFLALLVEAGAGRGIGFDPTYDGEVADTEAADRLEFVREYYSEAHAGVGAALVCCRHVLEHLDDPASLLTGLARTLAGSSAPVYFEVPNAEYVMSARGIWDLIYQHVSYFTAPALAALFERCGFEVLSLRPAFHDQFLAVEARPGPAHPAGARQESPELVRGVTAFRSLHEHTVETWSSRLSTATAEGEGRGERVLWGAGAKGVTFLNMVKGTEQIAVVVDVNPRKQGTYVPGTGQPIVAPKELAGRRVDTVIVVNPAYEQEIRLELAGLGLAPEVVSL